MAEQTEVVSEAVEQNEDYWLDKIQQDFQNVSFGLDEVEGGYKAFNGTELLEEVHPTAPEAFKAIYDSLKADKTDE